MDVHAQQRAASVFCPSKINLMLAVTGKREDGYHDIVSLVAPLDFGDMLWVELQEHASEDSLTADVPWLDCGSSNLVLQATRAYRRRVPGTPPAMFRLSKRIPVGAGLGGGSSDAAGAISMLNELMQRPLGEAELNEIALEVGSDVPLFLCGRSCIMRGRGELLEPLPESLKGVFRDMHVGVFKPSFSVSTVWAYGALEGLARYSSAQAAESRLGVLQKGECGIEDILHNDFEEAVGGKYVSLQVMLRQLRDAGTPCLLSGSGSACFALIENATESVRIRNTVKEAWGDGAWLAEARIIG